MLTISAAQLTDSGKYHFRVTAKLDGETSTKNRTPDRWLHGGKPGGRLSLGHQHDHRQLVLILGRASLFGIILSMGFFGGRILIVL